MVQLRTSTACHLWLPGEELVIILHLILTQARRTHYGQSRAAVMRRGISSWDMPARLAHIFRLPASLWYEPPYKRTEKAHKQNPPPIRVGRIRGPGCSWGTPRRRTKTGP